MTVGLEKTAEACPDFHAGQNAARVLVERTHQAGAVLHRRVAHPRVELGAEGNVAHEATGPHDHCPASADVDDLLSFVDIAVAPVALQPFAGHGTDVRRVACLDTDNPAGIATLADDFVHVPVEHEPDASLAGGVFNGAGDDEAAPDAVRSTKLYAAAGIMLPDHDWGWLKAITSRLCKSAPKRPRMGPVITSMQLLDLGEKLMDESKSAPACPISKQDAVNYRDGFLAAFVAFIPVRLRNLAAIEIDRHLVRHGDRRFIIIPGEETKNAEPIEFPFPEQLEGYVSYYLDVVRPRLLQHTNNSALWVSRQRSALSQVTIGKIFQRLSGHLGVHVSPHDARDAAATLWAISRPDQISVSSDLLGHADLRMNKHYNRARGIEASRAHARVIAAIRRKQKRRSG